MQTSSQLYTSSKSSCLFFCFPLDKCLHYNSQFSDKECLSSLPPWKLQILLQQNNISYFLLNSKIIHEESLAVVSLCSALKYSC